MTDSEQTLKAVQDKLKEIENLVAGLPAGYRYKVRELGSCIETVVSMYDDVQRGVIPDILKEIRQETPVDNEVHHDKTSKVLQYSGSSELL